MVERDDPFLDLGYTDPDRYQELRAGRSDVPVYPAKHRPYRRRSSGIGPQYGEESGVGYEGGIPPELQPAIYISDEQLARNALGKASAVAALELAKSKSPIYASDKPLGTPAEQAAERNRLERRRSYESRDQ